PDKTKALLSILQEASGNMFEDVMYGITFQDLPKYIGDVKKNVFIGFLVESEIDLSSSNSNYIEIIAAFIKKIEAIRLEHIPRITFFYLIYLLEGKMNSMVDALAKYFNDFQYFPLGKLTDVQLQ